MLCSFPAAMVDVPEARIALPDARIMLRRESSWYSACLRFPREPLYAKGKSLKELSKHSNLFFLQLSCA